MIDFLLGNLDSILSGITALLGAISYVSYKEKKREQKLENDKREAEAQALKLENNSKIIEDCYNEINRLKEDLRNIRTEYQEIVDRKDQEIRQLRQRIKELETQVSELKAREDAREVKRNAKGQFTKKSAQ